MCGVCYSNFAKRIQDSAIEPVIPHANLVRYHWSAIALGISLAWVFSAVASSKEPPQAQAPTADQIAFFEVNVRPVLENNCLACHGQKLQMASLRLDSFAGLQKGGESGPAFVSGNPDTSLLILAVRQSSPLKMPKGGKLKPTEIADLEAWVKMGAPWPVSTPEIRDDKNQLWSLQQVKKPIVPKIKNAALVRNPIDAFVLAKLESEKESFAPAANRRTLLRRVTYDLTGLPPTAADTDGFLADKSPDAYDKVVDRLLNSPRYGERWARLWLDVARYADTKGYAVEEDRNYYNAYTYRDWVIDAFNRDLPYDQFIVQQLAADRLPEVADGEDKHPLAALGFLTIGRRFLNNLPDIIDDRIDVTMRGFQGLTVTCARCHNHKFDPIPTQDYYSLYAVFASSIEVQAPISPPSVHDPSPEFAMAMTDSSNPADGVVFKRGNPQNPGDPAPRRFLAALTKPGAEREHWTSGSGRLELAKSIASKDNPLTARVFVNRIWMHHFGAGLVRTPSDFGHQGERPTHPELLDFLAATFMENGWSIKKLQKMIVLSATYRQSSTVSRTVTDADPENRSLGRMNRRRLDLEQMRDTLMSASGQLDLSKVGGKSVDLWAQPFARRRAVYGFIERQNLPGIFKTFDFASPDSTNSRRFLTTVPQQALFFMNSPLTVEQARMVTERPEIEGAQDETQRVKRLYRLLFARMPSKDELAAGLAYLKQGGLASIASPDRVWNYGYGVYDVAQKRVSAFTPFAYFGENQYRVSKAFPDPDLGYLMLSPQGGHPGHDGTKAVIRRWIAPATMTIQVEGFLAHAQPEGDGVRARIVSSRSGMIGEWQAHNSEIGTTSALIPVQKGDTIDFVVDAIGKDSFNTFTWAPAIRSADREQTWDTTANFGPPPPPALTRLTLYAQALIMTNEFLFVD